MEDQQRNAIADGLAWTLHPPVGGSLPGAVWLADRVHADTSPDRPEELHADLDGIAAPVERTIHSLGEIARAHLDRRGGGGAGFHVWSAGSM